MRRRIEGEKGERKRSKDKGRTEKDIKAKQMKYGSLRE